MHRVLAVLFGLKGSLVMSELFGISTLTIAGFIPVPTPDIADISTLWMWRAIITASILLNLHFLRKVYFKVGQVDRHTAQIATMVIAIEYLATEAQVHGAHRSTDKLLLTLLEQVKRLQSPLDKEP